MSLRYASKRPKRGYERYENGGQASLILMACVTAYICIRPRLWLPSSHAVNVDTGEILVSVTGTGESARSGTDLVGAGGSGWSGGGSHLDMGSSNFGHTILGEVVKQAVTQLATGLEGNASKLPVAAAPAPVPVNDLVADASSGDIINVGSPSGVHVGDKNRPLANSLGPEL